MVKLFLVAGEASGDRLGGALMAGLRELGPPDIRFCGVGGPLMQAQGLDSIFPMSDLSVMGLTEVLRRYPLLRRRLNQTVAAVIAAKPDALITIDSPDFSLRVARMAGKALPDLRVMHYVAPSVWAWRPGRAARMAQYVDHVLALLPFEPALMHAAGMTSDFVGHPVTGETRATDDQIAAFRARHGLQGPVLLLLPGSRRGELARLGPRFSDTARLVADQVPDLRCVLPTLPALVDQAREIAAPTDALIVTQPAEKLAAFGAADVALAASGTVSLELAANDTPMVIGYDMAPVSRWLIGHLLQVNTVTLVNLVSETRAVPEFLGKDCRPAAMADALLTLLRDPTAAQAQHDAMAATMRRLGAGGEAAGLRAARSVLRELDQPRDMRRTAIQPPPRT